MHLSPRCDVKSLLEAVVLQNEALRRLGKKMAVEEIPHTTIKYSPSLLLHIEKQVLTSLSLKL